MKKQLIYVISILCFGAQLYAQYEIPKKPRDQKAVYQYKKGEILKPEQVRVLNQKLVRYADSTTTQIVIAAINSTDGEDILYLGAQWANKWGIGQEKQDNGIFILVAKGDRKISINTGYGVEEYLTDALSKRIINNTMRPAFKKGNYYNGLNKATDQIIAILDGNFDTSELKKKDLTPWDFILWTFILVIPFIIIGHLMWIRREWKKRKDDGQDVTFGEIFRDYTFNDGVLYHPGGSISSQQSSGSFGSGFGGGGFGGGGFGGGGASGGW